MENSTLVDQRENAVTHAQELPLGCLSDLIRSKRDAMIVYEGAGYFCCPFDEGCFDGASNEEIEEQYRSLLPYIEKWDSPEFTVKTAKAISEAVDKLTRISFLYSDAVEFDGQDLGFAKGLLEMLASAAARNAARNEQQIQCLNGGDSSCLGVESPGVSGEQAIQ